MDSIAIIFLWKYNVSEIDSHSFFVRNQFCKKKNNFFRKKHRFFCYLNFINFLQYLNN